MTMTRDDLREHLLATIEAAPDLDVESRRELADVFLRELDENFSVLPKGAPPPTAWTGYRPVPRAPRFTPTVWPLLFAVPVLVALSFAAHVPFLLAAFLIFFVARSFHHRPWKSRQPTYYV